MESMPILGIFEIFLPNLLDNRQIKQIYVFGNISFISERAIMHDIFFEETGHNCL